MNNRRIVATLIALASLAFGCEGTSRPAPSPTRVPPTPVPRATTVDDAIELRDTVLHRIGKGRLPEPRWSQDGTRVVAATTSGIYLYDGSTLAPMRHFFSPVSLRSIDLSPDNRFIASADWRNETNVIELWDTASGALIRKLQIPEDYYKKYVKHVRFSRDGARVVAVVENGAGAVLQWDANSGALLYQWRPSIDIRNVAVSPGGSQLAVVGDVDRSASLWTLGNTSSMLITGVKYYAAPVFSPDGAMVAFAGEDYDVKVVNTATGQVLRSLAIEFEDGRKKGTATALAISPDGKQIAAGFFRSNERLTETAKLEPEIGIALWNLDNGELIHVATGQKSEIDHMAFTQDGRYIIYGSVYGEVVGVWNIHSGAFERVIDVYASGFDLHPDGDRILTWGYGAFKVWDANSGSLVRATQRVEGVMSSPAFSPDGLHIAFGVGNDVMIRNARTGDWVSTLKGHIRPPDSVFFSPDGTRIVSASLDETIKVWDARSGALLLNIPQWLPQFIGPGDYNYGRSWTPRIAFSPDGARLASGTFDKVVRIWDVRSGRLLHTLPGHEDDVTGVAFNPAGTHLVSSSKDQTIRIWDMQTVTAVLTITGHVGGVWSAAFSPDGTRIVSAGADGTVRLWDAVSGALQQILTGHSGSVFHAVFSPDGAIIASGSGDKSVRLWDVQSGRQLAVNESHTDTVENVAFSPDGQIVAASSRFDGTIDLWRFEEDIQ